MAIASDPKHDSRIKMKLELIPVPVTDVDRAKAFYVDKIGFNADHDFQVTPTLRFVQLTPHGSACSIAIGDGITKMSPGSQKNLQMVVKSAKEAHDALVEKGVDVSDVDEQPWGHFVYFSDPDGNTWALQEIVPQG